MHDKSISISMEAFYAGVAWATTFGLLLAGTLFLTTAESGIHVGGIVLFGHALTLSAVSATLSIRVMLRRHARLIGEAFKLGRETGTVRRIGQG